MTVKEQLTELKTAGVKNIKLGSGAGFVYCGKLDKQIQSKISRLSIASKNGAERDIKRKQEFLKNYIDWRKHTIAKQVGKHIENCDVCPPPEKFVAWYKAAERFCENEKHLAEVRIVNLTRRLENWVDFPAREIKEIYPSQTEPNCMIVIMDGEETGQYWTIREYETGEVDEDE